jgi:hypothetical protein
VSQAAERPAASEMIRTYALKAIDQEIAELRPRLDQLCELSVKLHATNGNGAAPVARKETAPRKKRRTMSAAARRRISLAQKARWAKQRAEGAKPARRK